MTTMTDIELLPLPEMHSRFHPMYWHAIEAVATNYARACVAHATAKTDAEIERLRVDLEAWKASHSTMTDTCHHFQARAERLAEALREMLGEYEHLHAKFDLGDCQATMNARALLRDQEVGNG